MKSISQDGEKWKRRPKRENHLTKVQSCEGKLDVARNSIAPKFYVDPFPPNKKKKQEGKRMKRKDNGNPSFYAIDSQQQSQGESFSHSLFQLQEHQRCLSPLPPVTEQVRSFSEPILVPSSTW